MALSNNKENEGTKQGLEDLLSVPIRKKLGGIQKY